MQVSSLVNLAQSAVDARTTPWAAVLITGFGGIPAVDAWTALSRRVAQPAAKAAAGLSIGGGRRAESGHMLVLLLPGRETCTMVAITGSEGAYSLHTVKPGA